MLFLIEFGELQAPFVLETTLCGSPHSDCLKHLWSWLQIYINITTDYTELVGRPTGLLQSLLGGVKIRYLDPGFTQGELPPGRMQIYAAVLRLGLGGQMVSLIKT